MPVRDLGYRAWNGPLDSVYQRWWVIAETGVRLTWRSMWLRRLLLLAWMPAVFSGLGFFLYENAAKQQVPAASLARFGPPFARLPQFNVVVEALESGDLEQARHRTWSWLMWIFFRYPQGTLMVVLVGLIAPPLISHDVRSKAFLIYFSRPISPWEYVLGKAAILFAYLSMITMLPALSLYVLGVMLSPDLTVIQYTWDLPLRVIAASLLLMVPTISLALCYSSLTRETRYASFAWFATWILGWVAFRQLTATSLLQEGMAGLARVSGRWELLSLHDTLGIVQNWVFGLQRDPELTALAALLLGIVTVFSLGVLHWRVSAPMRV